MLSIGQFCIKTHPVEIKWRDVQILLKRHVNKRPLSFFYIIFRHDTWECIHHPKIQESSDWYQYLHIALLFAQKLMKMLPHRIRALLICRFSQFLPGSSKNSPVTIMCNHHYYCGRSAWLLFCSHRQPIFAPITGGKWHDPVMLSHL